MAYAIEIKDLKKRYGNGFEALKGIDLTVEQGDFFALLGPNGAGKSTTIGILCSLVNKSSGSVNIFGVDIDKDFAGAKRYLGVVPQEFNFNVFETVFNVVVTQAGFYGIPTHLAEERAEKYLKKLDLWDKKDTQSRMLSGGMKRRLMIARALIHEPKVLILDEPTAGVDIELRRSMWEFIKELNEQGTTIILTTHYLEEAEQLCRNIAIINSGEIVENTSVKALLKTLSSETFVLDLDESIDQVALEGYDIKLIGDGSSVEVAVMKGQNLNDVFAYLNQQNAKVVSMRNKSNRLEELFVKLIKGSK
ncbi:Daunorubicin/doxorubicin resistance ATP-binding protein DrrA [Marinomonas aquimarina]|uniref:Daunorubicin/doxorubicin resistance ATP-binding protein DrrA n=1 Tax=Marinomonas aquimarina TaxID=295068 RepID=A0A1A8TGN5_9GAMM|nr:ABC transporter ATP-binding protein [Marinomonas aquimarina]SBS31774.1 Daunorubicin/doxorubicin resistance ATP-binding protein DrrA [Marinomonas aquimarina]